MSIAETVLQKAKRVAKQVRQFPELSFPDVTPDDIFKVDNFRRAAGLPLTSVGRAVDELNRSLGIGSSVEKSAGGILDFGKYLATGGSITHGGGQQILRHLDRPGGAIRGALTENAPLYKGFLDPGRYPARDIAPARRFKGESTVLGKLGLDVSRRTIAGEAINAVTDPLNLVPLGGASRAATKVLTRMPGRVGQEAAREVLQGKGLPRAATKIAGSMDEVSDPVSKLTNLVKAAKPAKRETEFLRSQERRRRVAAGAAVLDRGGPGAFQRSLATQAGELPKAKFDLPEELLPGDVAQLEDRIIKSSLRYYEKINAQQGLQRLLLGDIPQGAQLEKMELVFGSDLVKAILAKRSAGTKLREGIVDIANTPRALMSSFDLSGILRQAVIAAPSHPKEWAKNLPTYLRALRSQDAADAVDAAIRATKYAPEKEQLGLYRAPYKGVARGLEDREEAFMSRLVGKVPVIRGSERGYATFLNKLRSDIFDTVAKNWEGTDKLTDENMKALAHHINIITGRGDLGRLGAVAPELNALFFSPRLLASRIQVPIEVFTTTPDMRILVARDLAAFVGTGLSVLGLLKLAGAEVETDPTSSDFGKGKFGPTRIDFWGGFQQLARYTAQFAEGEGKSATTGEMYGRDRWKVIGDFLRSKLAPVPGSAINSVTGENMIGESVSLGSEALNLAIPIFLNDLRQAYEEYGLRGAITALPSGLGVNVSSYGGEIEPARQAGFFKIEKDAWQKVVADGQEVGIDLTGYKSYEDWRKAAKKELERQYDESGKDPVFKDVEVMRVLDKSPVAKAMSKVKQALERQLIEQNPDAIKKAIAEGYYRPSKEEQKALEKASAR